jgi:hypothetical protein
MKLILLELVFLLGLSGALCHACMETPTVYDIYCEGPNCSGSGQIIEPGPDFAYGQFPILGSVLCCGESQPSVIGAYGNCVGAALKVPRGEKRYVQLADYLIPDCRGSFRLHRGSRRDGFRPVPGFAGMIVRRQGS